MKLSVLVVDDTIFFRQTICELLMENKGIELVGTATNGKIALEKIEEHRPDLVTLDIEMPVMNGLEALKLIREHYPETTVVMISAASKGEAHVTIQALKDGAFDFIEKPDEGDPRYSEQYLREQLIRITDALIAQKSNPPPLL